MTALLAFSASALFATFIYFFDLKAIIALLLLAGVLITRTFILHSKKSKKKEADKEFDALTSTISSSEILVETSTNISETLQLVKNAYLEALTGLLKDDNRPLKSSGSAIKQLQIKQEQLRRQLFKLIKRLGDQPARSGRLFILASDLEQDMVQSISLIVETSSEYVDNRLDPVNSEHRDALVLLKGQMDIYLDHLIKSINGRTLGHIESHLKEKNKILNQVEKLLSDQIHNIRENGTSIRESSLILTILLETKDLAAVAARFAKLYHRISFE
jgi:Na+/phosphate symporter